MSKALDAQEEKATEVWGWRCGRRGVLWRRLFSLHTLGTEHASTSRQSDVSSLRDVYFCCVVCGSQNISFIQSIVRPLLKLKTRHGDDGGELMCELLQTVGFDFCVSFLSFTYEFLAAKPTFMACSGGSIHILQGLDGNYTLKSGKSCRENSLFSSHQTFCFLRMKYLHCWILTQQKP